MKTLVILVIAAGVSLCDAAVVITKPKVLSPVIFVPGDGGSQIEAKWQKSEVPHYICSKSQKDWYSVWLNMELLTPVVIDCWIDNVRLIYDNDTRCTSNTPGVETRVPGWGQSEVVEYLDPFNKFFSVAYYFKFIGDALVQNGYTRNLNIRGAPYDFRKGPNELPDFFTNMKALVEETFEANEDTPVTLLCHSMGCPLSLIFLEKQEQAWKDRFVARLVSLAGAWGGSAKAVKVYAIGDDLGALALRAVTMRAEQITMPSLAFLLPHPLFWKPDEVLVRTASKEYTIKDLQAFLEDLDYPQGWEMRKDMAPFLNLTAPGVEVHCIYGSGVNTVEVLEYKSTDLSATPKLLNGDGDGTVNLRSLKGCLKWRSQQSQEVSSLEIPGGEHMKILSDDSAIEYIMQILVG